MTNRYGNELRPVTVNRDASTSVFRESGCHIASADRRNPVVEADAGRLRRGPVDRRVAVTNVYPDQVGLSIHRVR